jgi:hypothetical protein
MIHLPSLLLGGVLIASFAVNLHATAQTTDLTQTTPTPVDALPSGTDVTIGEWLFEMPQNEPVAVFPVAVSTNLSGGFTTITVAVRHPDNTVTGLTECDNLAVICRPVDVQGTGALEQAAPGDVFVLASEGT